VWTLTEDIVDRDALEIVAPDRRRHAEDLIDLVAKVFGGNNFYRFRDYCRRGYILNSHYDWDVSRIGLLDGRIVTHYGVWGYRMRIGTAEVRTAGIGAVATDGDLRKRGLMAPTARASVGAMRAAGYDFSILFGIDDFYYRFGYVRAWSDTVYVVKTADLPAGRPASRLHRFAPRDRDDLRRIYEREHAGMTGTAVRPTYPRDAHPGRYEGHLWTDAKGRTAGYVLTGRLGAAFECVEAGGDIEESLRVVAALARRAGADEVRFATFPHASGIARRLRRGNCRAETHHRRRGGCMVRTVNLAAALEKMRGELGRRLRASRLAGWRGNLLLCDAREKVTLAIDRSRVRVAPPARSKHAIRGGDAVAQLLIGTEDPGEVAEMAGMRLAGDARQLAAVLFPSQHPALCQWDRY